MLIFSKSLRSSSHYVARVNLQLFTLALSFLVSWINLIMSDANVQDGNANVQDGNVFSNKIEFFFLLKKKKKEKKILLIKETVGF